MSSSTTSAAPIKVGFIGLSRNGWASVALAPSLTQPSLRGRYSLVALSTSSESSAKDSSEKWSAELGYEVKGYHGDPRNLLKGSPEVDLVAISVKTPFHKQNVLPVIRAGKNFFIEWPVGRTSDETKEFAEEAKKYGVRSMIGFQGRKSAVVHKVKELIESGKIGKVLSANIVALFPREMQSSAPEIKQKGAYVLDKSNGTTLVTVPIGHQLDVLTYLLGNVKTINALETTHYPTVTILDDTTGKPTGETRPFDGPDHMALNARLDTGVLLNILWRCGTKASTPGRISFTAIIDGEEGTIKLQSNDLIAGAFTVTESELYVNGEKVEVLGSEAGVAGMLTRNWEEYAKGEKGKYATIDDAVRLKKVLDAIDESVSTGRRVDVVY